MSQMTVNEIGTGVWRWTVSHPEWNGDPDWGPRVSSVYLETPDAIVLFDPLVPAQEPDRDRFWRALDRDVARTALPVVVALTCRWHVRTTGDVVARYPGSSVFAPARGGHGFGDLVTDVPDDGTAIAAGVTAWRTGSPVPNEEFVYLVEGRGVLIVGDIVLGTDDHGLRLAPASWYDNSDDERHWYRDEVRTRLSQLAGPDLRVILPAHGEPVTDQAADVWTAALR